MWMHSKSLPSPETKIPIKTFSKSPTSIGRIAIGVAKGAVATRPQHIGADISRLAFQKRPLKYIGPNLLKVALHLINLPHFGLS